jgi:hypothetical protein
MKITMFFVFVCYPYSLYPKEILEEGTKEMRREG